MPDIERIRIGGDGVEVAKSRDTVDEDEDVAAQIPTFDRKVYAYDDPDDANGEASSR